MNLPNAITLARIPLMFAISVLMCCHWVGAPTLAFILFLAAAGGDWLDGYIARRWRLVTTFGKLMDALTDKIMVLGLVITFVGSAQFLGSPRHEIAILLALVTLCREFMVTGMRMAAAAKGVIVAADRGGKSKTLTQLIALGFLLGAPMIGRDLSFFFGRDLTVASRVVQQIGEYIFIVGTILAVWSGWRYFAQFRSVAFGGANE
ncbi:MAG: CDP-diacylglycerol--glycerol-3-phosphate 3-phosphatidyltransferase [Opitutaceae bacterium]|jgi:CDP-diacylglycerol--glycerol-3-phosphate 3-phosphatidyltransferase